MAKKYKKGKKLGAVAFPKGKKYFLKDAHDRLFTDDGIRVELHAGIPTEVSKDVAKLLKDKYSYLEVIAE